MCFLPNIPDIIISIIRVTDIIRKLFKCSCKKKKKTLIVGGGVVAFRCRSPVSCWFPSVKIKNDVSSTFASYCFPGASDALGRRH